MKTSTCSTYKLCLNNVAEFTPIIYTPVGAEFCRKSSAIYRRPEEMHISTSNKAKTRPAPKNWPEVDEARSAVVTNDTDYCIPNINLFDLTVLILGSRILGPEDLGAIEMGISVGKLSIYVARAGIRLRPIVSHRIGGEETTELMDEPIHETPAAFSKLLIQLEDFLTDRAFMWPAKFWSKYPLFNDATQGTGAVVLSGFTNAAKFCSTASGKPSISYRPLFFGAGFAGVRIAMQLMSFFTMQGLSEKEARERIWLVDFQGLVFDEHRPMAEHKEYFSRKDYAGPPIKDLLDILEYVKSTAFLGISTISNVFQAGVIEAMAVLNPRPIILPLFNPVNLSERSFQDAI
ncbi:hypothetical protein F5877DRAFT_82284 [Lentinula edodes]|nr:hypothetical protein F5877DRAFT_82284 [Lentinula edodes]